jgi:uncharacterized protein (DUF58 family)
VRPTRRGLGVLATWLVSAAVVAVWPGALGIFLLHGVVLAALFGWDGVAVRRRGVPTAEREVRGALPLGQWSQVRLRLAHPGAGPLRVEVFDHYPVEAAEVEELPRRLTLPPGGWAEVTYRLRPIERGNRSFGGVEMTIESPAGLWRRRVVAGAPETVRVLPDFQAVAGYALLAVEDRLGQMGVRLQPRRGEGLEFHQLRDYRRGDVLRQVDWKATSRRGKLISRDYQEERNQQVVFVVDCGRRLRARDGELSHFDHVLNAVLLVAYAALRQGDAVGILTFAGAERWMPPRKGPAALPEVMRNLYDLEATHRPPDVQEAARRLAAVQRRRALVVLVTNVRDEDDPEMAPALALLRPRHLVLLASLREAALDAALAEPPDDLRAALLTASVHQYLAARDAARERLRAHGILSLDVVPAQLPVALLNRYLEIKRSGAL